MTLRAFYTFCVGGCAGGWAWIGLSCFSGQGVWQGCLFKQFFHIPCPACGSTRAIMALLRGDVPASFAYNPLGALSALLLVALPVGMLCDWVRRRAVLYGLFLRVDKQLLQPRVFAAFVFVVLLNWAWVILHVH